jgi:hypothetical protein
MQEQVPMGARRAIRRAVELECELVSPHHDEPIRYALRDLTPFGLWITTREPLRTGEQVVACFTPDGGWSGGELMVFAEVARVTTSRRHDADPSVGMGLELMDLSDEEAGMLRAWLAGRSMPRPRRRRPLRQRHIEVTPLSDALVLAKPAEPPSKPAALLDKPLPYRALGSCWR